MAPSEAVLFLLWLKLLSPAYSMPNYTNTSVDKQSKVQRDDDLSWCQMKHSENMCQEALGHVNITM